MEDRIMKEKLCEVCGKRPGVMTSAYWFEDPRYEYGVWVCENCERELEQEHRELEESGYFAEM